jgi:hypothetical protein
MDIGQLTRWEPEGPFTSAFAASYEASGGRLPEDWLRWASVFDLANRVGLMEKGAPGSRRAVDLEARIATTLAHT